MGLWFTGERKPLRCHGRFKTSTYGFDLKIPTQLPVPYIVLRLHKIVDETATKEKEEEARKVAKKITPDMAAFQPDMNPDYTQLAF